MTTHPVAGGLFISRKTQAFFLFTYVAFLSLFAVFLALYLKEHGKNQTQTMRIKANFGPRGSSSQKGNVASKTDAQEPEWVLSRYVYCTKNPSLTLITMVPPEPELKNVTGASVKQLLSHNIRTLSHMLDPSFEHVILQTAESGETMYGACNALFEQFQGEYMGHVAYDSYALDMNFIGHIRDYLRSHKAAPQLIVFQTVDATTGRVEPAEGSESVLVGGHEPVPSLSQVLFHKKLYVHPAVQKARTKSPQATLEAALNLCSEHEVVWLPLKAFFTHVVDSDIFPRKPEYVTVKLDGGLGNQMFEVATAYAYARDTGKQLVLDRSLTVVSPDAPVSRRTYWQETFSWTDDLPTHSQSCRAKALRASPPSKGDIAPFDAEEAFSFASRKSGWNSWSEPSFLYQPLLHYHGHVNLEGYFQSDQYFSSYRTDLAQLFTGYKSKSPLALPESYQTDTIISVHFRRSDYVGSSIHTNQSEQYYLDAVKTLQERLNLAPVHLLIFSDDLKWCRQHLPKLWPHARLSYLDMVFPGQSFTDAEEMMLMSLCHHHVIANSSFSWWGAYLDLKSGSLTVAPKLWFSEGVPFWHTIYVDGWLVM